MLRIETTATVAADGTCVVRVPAALPTGSYRVILLVGDDDEAPSGGSLPVEDAIGSNAEAQAAAYEAVYRSASARR